MRNGSVVEWKISGDIGKVIKMEGDYTILEWVKVEDEFLIHKKSDWIRQSELKIIQE